jgi:quinol monooxygenase YgiN
MAETMYCYLWEYEVRPDAIQAFEDAYGRHGAWVRLFECDKQYVRTELLRDRDRPGRYVTIDYWFSRDACEAFRVRHTAEFEAIDKACAALTIREQHIGDFDF